MKLLRRVLTIAAFWSLMGVSLAATVQVWRQGLPLEDSHWSVRRVSEDDFAKLSNDQKLRFAWRLEREFSRGVVIEDAVRSLDPDAQERFEQNFDELTELWLFEKVNTYFAIEDDQARGRYLDRQVTRVKTWPIFAAMVASGSASDEDKARLERLTSYILSRSQELSLEERQRLQRFLFELAVRSYQVHQFFPGLQLTF